MSDQYGATHVPLAASTAGEDPLLASVLSYFQAIGNAHAIAEWTLVAPGQHTTNNPIEVVHDCDPEQGSFNERDLPALFLWRSKTLDRAQLAQDVRVESSTLSLLWVPPPATQDKRSAIRQQFAAKLLKVLDVYLERNRDPAWVASGETDSNAASMGAVTETGTSPAMTISGIPASTSYSLRVEVTTGGARGTAVIKWSTDGGTTYTTGVLTAATVALGSTGLTLHFGAGTYHLGDFYVSSATGRGSSLAKFAKFRRLKFQGTQPRPLNIEVQGTQPRKYLAYVTEMALEEELAVDATRFDELDGADVTISVPAAPPSQPSPLVVESGSFDGS